MADELIRIGKGPKGPRVKRPVHYWMVAAAVLVAVGTMGTIALLQNPIGAPAAAPSAAIDRQIQCTSINREYDAWVRGKDELAGLADDSSNARYFVKQLMEEGKALAKATRDYDDAATKQLAVTVATYNVDLAALNMSVVLAGEFPTDQYLKVVDSWAVVETAFKAFKNLTCR